MGSGARRLRVLRRNGGQVAIELLEDIYARRLQRMCIWIAETEEDARQLAEAAKEAEAAAANDDNVKADLSKGVMIVQKRSRITLTERDVSTLQTSARCIASSRHCSTR